MRIFRDRYEPCCGFSLRWAVRFMSVLNVLMIIVGLGLLAKDVLDLWDKWQIEKVQRIFHYYMRLGLWLCYVVHVGFSIPVDIILFRSLTKENVRAIKFCYYATLLNTTWAFCVYYFHTFFFGLHVPSLALYNGYLGYKFYECVVINYFAKQIKVDRELASEKRNLTEKEVEEFEEGLPTPADYETKDLLEKVNYERFRKEEYEIPLSSIIFDMSSVLGQGAFGCVYKAQLIKGDGYETTVAVKMINPTETDATYFKALLTELKIMSSIGKHENIVQLVGATTGEIRQRKLSIVLEFCAHGSLTDYLRGNRGLFKNMVKDGEINTTPSSYDVSPFSESEQISTTDLIKWSYQVAKGMAYLESKRVIHGDLAARNVLLNAKRDCKISDFGLARQLYAYSVYVKTQNTPLPWRHLALESLTDMNFSSASDCWSYGIALVEFFTLGESPWPGYEFSLAFVEQLKHGLRPRMPPYATNFMFDLMNECWEGIPEKRPSFNEILTKLELRYSTLLGIHNYAALPVLPTSV